MQNLFSRKIFLYISIVLIVSACDNCDPGPGCDIIQQGSDCYLDPQLSLVSIDDQTIQVSIDLDCDSCLGNDKCFTNIDYIELVRDEELIGSIPFERDSSSASYLDFMDIVPDNEYIYNIFLVQDEIELGLIPKLSLIDTIIHIFSGIEIDNVLPLSFNEFDIFWTYTKTIDSSFDSMSWEIERLVYDIATGELEDSSTINITTDITDDNSYSYTDQTEYSMINKTVGYKISLIGELHTSQASAEKMVDVRYPAIANLSWTPLSSEIVYLEWDFEGGPNSSLDTLRISNNYKDPLYVGTDLPKEGHFIYDTLSYYAQSVSAGSNIEYYIETWLDGGYEKITIPAQTLPVENMVYVPGAGSIEPFYMDIYEVTNQLYKEVNDSHDTDDLLPVSDIDRDSAISWADSRSVMEGQDFSLPTPEMWEHAASCDYDFTGRLNDGQCLNQLTYPIYNSGTFLESITCNYANYAGCNDALVSVGSYDGSEDNYPNKLSISKFGIYDLSGNVSEWTESPSGPSSDFSRAYGGDFQSFSDEVKSGSYITVENTSVLPIIGFRTVISQSSFGE